MPKKSIVFQILCANDNKKDFFATMGEFFASMEIRRDFGYSIFDDNRQWVVAKAGDRVIAFGSFGADKNDAGHLYDAWVSKDYRRQGYYKRISDIRMRWMVEHNIQVVKIVIKPELWPMYERAGYEVVNKKGKYLYLSGAPTTRFCDE